jgi:antitoxin component of MazEF toxin-antitoxin module
VIKTLKPIGNSLGLIIDKPILELLRMDRDTKVEITTDGEGLFIRPVRGAHEERVARSLEAVNAEHAANLRRLAE